MAETLRASSDTIEVRENSMLSECRLVDLSGGDQTNQMPFVADKSSSLSFTDVRLGASDLGKATVIKHLMASPGDGTVLYQRASQCWVFPEVIGSVNLCLSSWHSLVPFLLLRRVDVGIPYQCHG